MSRMETQDSTHVVLSYSQIPVGLGQAAVKVPQEQQFL